MWRCKRAIAWHGCRTNGRANLTWELAAVRVPSRHEAAGYNGIWASSVVEAKRPEVGTVAAQLASLLTRDRLLTRDFHRRLSWVVLPRYSSPSPRWTLRRRRPAPSPSGDRHVSTVWFQLASCRQLVQRTTPVEVACRAHRSFTRNSTLRRLRYLLQISISSCTKHRDWDALRIIWRDRHGITAGQIELHFLRLCFYLCTLYFSINLDLWTQSVVIGRGRPCCQSLCLDMYYYYYYYYHHHHHRYCWFTSAKSQSFDSSSENILTLLVCLPVCAWHAYLLRDYNTNAPCLHWTKIGSKTAANSQMNTRCTPSLHVHAYILPLRTWDYALNYKSFVVGYEVNQQWHDLIVCPRHWTDVKSLECMCLSVCLSVRLSLCLSVLTFSLTHDSNHSFCPIFLKFGM